MCMSSLAAAWNQDSGIGVPPTARPSKMALQPSVSGMNSVYGTSHIEKILIGGQEEDVIVDDYWGPRRFTVATNSAGLNWDHAVFDKNKGGLGSVWHSHTKKWLAMSSTERSTLLHQVAKHNRSMRAQHGGEQWAALANHETSGTAS
mmetsp:Transcript_62817/g.183698  ORF Transcript_62817/g.183698 Transcript_62817/m.183698 type:complete len:147 (+) Transcript_62817:1-441(+)